MLHFVWDGDNLLQEYDAAAGTTQAHYTDYPGEWGGLVSLRRAAAGSRLNQARFNQRRFGQSAAPEASRFYGFDQSGNTRVLTDGSQAVTDSYTYQAFGVEVQATGSTVNPFRFGGEVGYYRDSGERTYVRLRHYSTSTGRWLSEDPIGYDSGDSNLYRYGGNNPANEIDLCGLDWMFNINGKAVIVNGFEVWGGWVKIFGSTPSNRRAVARAFDVIITTKRGQELLARMRGNKKPVWVHVGNLGTAAGERREIPAGTDLGGAVVSYVDDPLGKGRGNEIWIDPNLQLNLSTFAGQQKVPLDVQIVHELGHAVTGPRDAGPGRMANANRTENPYRAQRRRQLLRQGVPTSVFYQYSTRNKYGR